MLTAETVSASADKDTNETPKECARTSTNAKTQTNPPAESTPSVRTFQEVTSASVHQDSTEIRSCRVKNAVAWSANALPRTSSWTATAF